MNTRKSFVIHIDSLDVIYSMSGDQTKELLLAFRDYHLGIEPKLNGLMNAVFTQFKNQFDRDLYKYKLTVERNRVNGSKGGRPTTQINPKKPSGLFDNQIETKKPDNDNDNDNSNDSINNKIEFYIFWNLYGKKISSAECKKKWNKLPLEIQQKIIDTLPNFKSSIKDIQFLPHPSTYLNQERWNDEVSISNDPNAFLPNETQEERARRLYIIKAKNAKIFG